MTFFVMPRRRVHYPDADRDEADGAYLVWQRLDRERARRAVLLADSAVKSSQKAHLRYVAYNRAEYLDLVFRSDVAYEIWAECTFGRSPTDIEGPRP